MAVVSSATVGIHTPQYIRTIMLGSIFCRFWHLLSPAYDSPWSGDWLSFHFICLPYWTSYPVTLNSRFAAVSSMLNLLLPVHLAVCICLIEDNSGSGNATLLDLPPAYRRSEECGLDSLESLFHSKAFVAVTSVLLVSVEELATFYQKCLVFASHS